VTDDRPGYFTDRSHLLITGVTGARTRYGGKTALANWIATEPGSTFDLVVFYNPKQDDAPAEQADVEVATVEGVARAMRDGARHVCLTPKTAAWDEVHARLLEFIQALPRDMDKLVVHDEAPELDEDALATFARVAGNGSACKSVFISQQPGDAPSAVRNQSILVWVGPFHENARHVFRANGRENHADHIAETHKPYWWTVVLGPGEGDRDTYQPVPARYAGEGVTA
jgi:hypothetical protein